MDKLIEKMREMEIKLLIIEYNKASQLDRSLSKTKLSHKKKIEFRIRLLNISIKLMNMIDNGTLTNKIIRNKIRELKSIDKNISFGQAQKVLNVCLKQYCFIVNKLELIKELDCPLDTITMKGYGIKNNKMKNVNEDDYIKYQNNYFVQNNGIRILKDCTYDENRIKQFLSGGRE
jgi:hypothetical protein